VRGSSLLLLGKVLALGLNFVTQILIVRYLSKTDYGAFAYALSIAMLFKGLALAGLPDTVSRFIPIFLQARDYRSTAGTVLLGLATVLLTGLAFSAMIALGLAAFGSALVDDRTTIVLTMVLGLLVPLEALNDLLTALFATFSKPSAIFFRRYVVTPGLRLALIVGLIVSGAGVLTLTIGYLIVSAAGLLAYLWLFRGVSRDQAWFQEARRSGPRGLSYPVRTIFGFALPLLSTAVVWLVMESSDAIIIGYFHGSEAVANYRAVLPAARLNQLVILNAAVLFTPLAAAAFSRGDTDELSDLYWQTTLWILALTFPIFLLVFGFAEPLTTLVFGARYADAWPVLSLLSLGYFVHSALGYNGSMLKVFCRVRYLVSIDLAAALLNISLSLLLVPGWGATGAAVSTAATMVTHNALKQVGLWRLTGVGGFKRRYLVLYGLAAAISLGGFALGRSFPGSLLVAAAVVVPGSLLLGWLALQSLDLQRFFPELAKIPLLRRLVRV
jgi:O-antigen/teichoic acid export membrane protein